MTATLRRTPLHAEHVALGGRMTPFAGWDMPIQYAGIVEEHRAVRGAAGLFDVSHMLRAEVQGPGAAALLRWALTYDARALPAGRGHYALLCEPDGGIGDDVFIYRTGEERFLFVGNASNAAPDLERLREGASAGAAVTSRHEDTAMLALQGPGAAALLAPLVTGDVAAMRQRACLATHLGSDAALVARTGYTGEDGFELIIAAEAAARLWRTLVAAGARPCGLGARDTLRLEAALVLYGNDINRSTNPYESGLAWVVGLDDGAAFVGREALLALRGGPPARRLVCLRAEGRGIMRHGHAIIAGGRAVGAVTSGTYSPMLEVSIGMGYVEGAYAAPDTPVEVDVRGKPLAARVVPRPFYKRAPSS